MKKYNNLSYILQNRLRDQLRNIPRYQIRKQLGDQFNYTSWNHPWYQLGLTSKKALQKKVLCLDSNEIES